MIPAPAARIAGAAADGMRRLRRLWAGELPLRTAFWTYAVGIGLVVNLVTSTLFLALVAADRVLAALFVGYVLSVPYNVVAVVGVWRSAEREAGDSALGTLAKIVVLLGMIALSLT